MAQEPKLELTASRSLAAEGLAGRDTLTSSGQIQNFTNLDVVFCCRKSPAGGEFDPVVAASSIVMFVILFVDFVIEKLLVHLILLFASPLNVLLTSSVKNSSAVRISDK